MLWGLLQTRAGALLRSHRRARSRWARAIGATLRLIGRRMEARARRAPHFGPLDAAHASATRWSRSSSLSTTARGSPSAACESILALERRRAVRGHHRRRRRRRRDEGAARVGERRARDRQRPRTSASCAASTAAPRRPAAAHRAAQQRHRAAARLAAARSSTAPTRRDDVGAVAAKLVYPDGTLQEAGGIVWRDGSAWNFGRGEDPSLPEFNYVREVDYGSAAALLVRSEVWRAVGGFDERYAPAYYEDTDLCFAARALG